MKFRFGYSSKTKHPCLIVGKNKYKDYLAIPITTHPDDRHPSKKFNKNPNKNLRNQQYWHTRVVKHRELEILDTSKWKLSRKDKKEIKYFVKSKHFN